MKYKTLFFDADGTLLDFLHCEHDAISEVFKGFGLPDDDEHIAEYSRINQSLWESLQVGGITKAKLKNRRFELYLEKYGFSADITAMSAAYVEALSGQVHYIDGALDVCRELSKKHRLYIITNGITYVQQKRFEKAEITEYFKDIFISEFLGAEKPSVKFFEAAESRVPNFCREETLVIGDSLTSDIAGGVAAGYDTCFFNPDGKIKPDGMVCTYEIKRLEELYDIVG